MIVVALLRAVFSRWDHRLRTARLDACHECGRVIALVADDRLSLKAFDRGVRLLNTGYLTGNESKAQGIAKASTTVWILVLSPPRERPSACGPFVLGTSSMLMGTHDGAVNQQRLQIRIIDDRFNELLLNTFLNFRHLREAHELGRKLFEQVYEYLEAQDKSSVRAKVEHAFGVIKRVFGFVKVRYCGLEKNANRLFVACALANVCMVLAQLLRWQRA